MDRRRRSDNADEGLEPQDKPDGRVRPYQLEEAVLLAQVFGKLHISNSGKAAPCNFLHQQHH